MTFSLEFFQLDSYEQCSKPAKNAIGRRGTSMAECDTSDYLLRR